MNKDNSNSAGALRFMIPFMAGEAPINLVSVAPGILIISNQETVEIVEKWRPIIDKYSEALLAAGLTTPEAPMWLVSSIQHKPTGGERVEAQSHYTGNALDLAPIYSQECLTNPDALSPSLATDIINLLKIAELKVDGTFAVVEGDHLHIVAETDPFKDKVVTYPTLIPWYNAGAAYKADQNVQHVMEKFFFFKADACTYQPVIEKDVAIILATLNNYKAKG